MDMANSWTWEKLHSKQAVDLDVPSPSSPDHNVENRG